MTTVLIAAGDLSGETHAAEFVEIFRGRDPSAQFIGMGGAAMARAGVDLVVDQRELAVGGLFELAASAGRIVGAWTAMTRVLEADRPDLVVLVDSGGFNLPFARRVRQRTNAKILYYIAPQVWAWRQRRIRKLAARTDRIAVIFPFESEVYEEWGVEVEFVGHPLVDKIFDRAAGEATETSGDRKRARAALGLLESGPIAAIFPGSRRNELNHQLPIQLEAARRMRESLPDLQVVLGLAASIDPSEAKRRIAAIAFGDLEVRMVQDRTLDLLRVADLAIVKPGTITVEAMLIGCPMLVVGRANPLTAAVLRRAIRVDYLAMPNLIAGREIVPEFLQENTDPGRIAAAGLDLLGGERRERQIAALRIACQALGKGGAALRACEIAEDLLGTDRS